MEDIKMDFIVKSYVGAPPLFFGMTSHQIQDVLSSIPEKFKKHKDDEYDTDAFKWCHVYYKSPGICEAIEFFPPSIVTFNGVNLFERTFKEIKELFLNIDDSIECKESGLTSYKYGVSFYAPSAEDIPSKPVEGIIVFEKGYYE